MNSKKCMKCQNPALYKFVRVEGNQIHDMFFCQEHASELSPYLKPKIPLKEILANILNQEQAAQAEQGEEGRSSARCKTCGLPFDAYRKTLFLGCGDCYESFYSLLIPELRKFHGNIKHIGRRPGGGKETGPAALPKPPAPVALPAELPAEADDPAGEMVEAPAAEDPVHEIARLSQELAKAISGEDFEAAARLRDQIKSLRERLK